MHRITTSVQEMKKEVIEMKKEMEVEMPVCLLHFYKSFY